MNKHREWVIRCYTGVSMPVFFEAKERRNEPIKPFFEGQPIYVIEKLAYKRLLKENKELRKHIHQEILSEIDQNLKKE